MYNKDENNDTSIRTRKVSFVDMDPVHAPPPTIPGMVSLGKADQKKNAGSAKKTDAQKENGREQGSGKPKRTGGKRDNGQPKIPENAPETAVNAKNTAVRTENAKPGESQQTAGQKGSAKTHSGKKPAAENPHVPQPAPEINAYPVVAMPAILEEKTAAKKKKSAPKPKTAPRKNGAVAAVQNPETAKTEEIASAAVRENPKKQKKKNRETKAITTPAEVIVTSAEPVIQEPEVSEKPRKSRGGKPNGTQIVKCRFQYSGKGFGFGVPEEGEPVTEDIFLPPGETCDAMTGDIVRVEVQPHTEQRSADRGPEGVVRGITEHTVSSITGVVALDRYGSPVVMPDADRYKVTVAIPEKDMRAWNVPLGTKVAVEPAGRPYFQREDLSFRRIPKDHRQPKTRRQDGDVRDPEVRGRISAVFGKADTRQANYAAILHDAGIPTAFPPYVLRSAGERAQESLTPAGRRDLRSSVIFTIDGADAKDLDDAISLTVTDTGYVLGVHIADVSHYVPYGECVEKEARERGTSVYFVDKVVPMLPESLSNGACSLNAGEDKYALTCEITMDRDGKRTGGAIYRSLIRSTVRGVYSEVNALLAGTADDAVREKYAPVMPMLTEMHKLYVALRKNAASRGVVELYDCEAEIRLDDDGMPVAICRRERGEAERMIEQFMLSANMTAAELLHDHGMPCLYRIHETPEAEKIASFGVFAHNLGLSAGDITPEAVRNPEKLSHSLRRVLEEAEERGFGDTVSAVLLRSMMKAKYVAECKPHFGLGAPVYCHFTSPIRRYPDLFVHTVLNMVLPYTPDGVLTNDTALPDAALPEILAAAAADRGAWATECEIRAQTAEWRIKDLYIALYMQSHIGEEFDAVVSGVMAFGVFVRCDNLAEGLIPAHSMADAVIHEAEYSFRYHGRMYTLGAPMRVRLEEADVSAGKLTFSVI